MKTRNTRFESFIAKTSAKIKTTRKIIKMSVLEYADSINVKPRTVLLQIKEKRLAPLVTARRVDNSYILSVPYLILDREKQKNDFSYLLHIV